MFPMIDKLTFGQWLQIEREKRGWSQSNLARRAGKDRAVINKIESGGAMPAVKTYIAIANALDLSPIVLFRVAGLMPPITDLDADMQEILREISELPPGRRKFAKSLIKGMLAALPDGDEVILPARSPKPTQIYSMAD